MADERDVFTDKRSFRDLSVNWEVCCRTLFTDADFRYVPKDKAPDVVRLKAEQLYDDVPDRLAYLYAPAERVRRRLRLQGFTAKSLRDLWLREHARNVELMSGMVRYGPEFREKADALKSLTFEQWASDREKVASGRRPSLENMPSISLLDPFADLALHIDHERPKCVWIDLSDLYPGEFDPKLTVRQNLDGQEEWYEPIGFTGDTLVLTEGSSDARLLKVAIAAMYPEYADMFEFVDFDEFKVEGGASVLARMVKAFAGVRMQQRIIALFDNDAAGLEAKLSLDKIRLPPTIRTMLLPEVVIAADYPTLGPEGLRVMNVNGSAASIEMFLGAEALTGQDGKLRPVRWTGWNKPAQRYQGEIEGKGEVAAAFIQALRAQVSPEDLRQRYPDMDLLLNEIFEAFATP